MAHSSTHARINFALNESFEGNACGDYHLVPEVDPDYANECNDTLEPLATDLARMSIGMPSTGMRISSRRTSLVELMRVKTEELLMRPKTTYELLGEQIESVWFQSVMALMILGNAVVIGLETEHILQGQLFENIFLCVFIGELASKLIAFGPSRLFFPKNADFAWNVFDTIIVVLGITDVVEGMISSDPGSRGFATVFRTVRLLRILRVFRIVRFFKQLYLLAVGFTEAAKAVVWVTVLMFFLLYVCSIVLVRTVGHPEHDSPYLQFLGAKFSSIGLAMFTLFELMASPSIQEYHAQEGLLGSHPVFTIFLVGWVIFGSFGMIALLTGVISESMFAKNQVRLEEARVERELQHKFLEEWCEEEFERLSLNEEGEALISDVAGLLPRVAELCEMMGADFTQAEIASLASIMDVDNSGLISVQEFTRAIISVVEGNRPVSFHEIKHAIFVAQSKIDANAVLLNRVLHSLDLGHLALSRSPRDRKSPSTPPCESKNSTPGGEFVGLMSMSSVGCISTTAFGSARGSPRHELMCRAGSGGRQRQAGPKETRATGFSDEREELQQLLKRIGEVAATQQDQAQKHFNLQSSVEDILRLQSELTMKKNVPNELLETVLAEDKGTAGRDERGITSAARNSSLPGLDLPQAQEIVAKPYEVKAQGESSVDNDLAYDKWEPRLDVMSMKIDRALMQLQHLGVEMRSVSRSSDEGCGGCAASESAGKLFAEQAQAQAAGEPKFQSVEIGLSELVTKCTWEAVSGLMAEFRVIIREHLNTVSSLLGRNPAAAPHIAWAGYTSEPYTSNDSCHKTRDVSESPRIWACTGSQLPPVTANVPATMSASLTPSAVLPTMRGTMTQPSTVHRALLATTTDGQRMSAAKHPLLDMHYNTDAWAALSPKPDSQIEIS